MTNFNMKALVAALIAAYANPSVAMDLPGDGPAGVGAPAATTSPAAASTPGDSVDRLSENTKHVTVLKKPRADLPTLPIANYELPRQLSEWFDMISNSRVKISAPKAGVFIPFDDGLNFAIKLVAGKMLLGIPFTGGHNFGFSLPCPSDSDIHQFLSHILSNKLVGEAKRQLDVLELAPGHAFGALQFFMENADITWHGIELKPDLVAFFNEHTKPLLASVDSKKADRFTLMQGDVRNPDHMLFGSPSRDIVTAFNLFHYLDVKDWPVVLQNMHNALKPDGFAVFVMSFKELDKELDKKLDMDLSMAKLLEHSGMADQGPEKIKAYLQTLPPPFNIPEHLMDVLVARFLGNPLFPNKMKMTVHGFAQTLDEASPGTIFPDRSRIIPYSFNDLQAIHCVEHTGHFRAQSYGIIDASGALVSKEDAISRSESETFSIFVIASPVARELLYHRHVEE